MLRTNCVRLLEQRLGLLQVDDVDAAPLGEDVAAHLRVPAPRLVAEVHSGLQELAHADDGHGSILLRLLHIRPAAGGWNRGSASRHRHPPVLRRVGFD